MANMASLLSKQAFGCLNQALLVRSQCCRRSIHSTPAVRKKSKVDVEDLFDDEGPVEDLIKDEPATQSVATAEKPPLDASIRQKKKLSPERRLELFNGIRDFVLPRLGKKPKMKTPLVKSTVWFSLLALATSEEQLRTVANMFPGWKDTRKGFGPGFSELFIRRCQELRCPLLALEVFGDYAKYNLKLTLPGAHNLLHSLHMEHPVDTVMTASALYSVYGLPPASQDLVSCSLIVSACFKHASKDSIAIANALVPHLRTMLENTEPIKIEANPVWLNRNRSSLWLRWTLKKIDKALYAQNGSRANWLAVWRAQSGHIPEPSQM